MNPTAQILAFLVACGLVACERAPATGDEACAALEEERVAMTSDLDTLDEIVRALPADSIRYADRTQEELGRFSESFKAINKRLDAMYDEHEVACKWPMIEEDDFGAVFETVYAPHIELVGRQVDALVAVADKLEASGPDEVVGEAHAGFRRTAEALVSGLRSQILVCETDFSDASCRPYKEAVEGRFGKPGRKSVDADAKPTEDTSAEADADENTAPAEDKNGDKE